MYEALSARAREALCNLPGFGTCNAAHGDHVAAVPGYECAPLVHNRAALVEVIGSGIRCLNAVPHGMGKAGFSNLSRRVCRLPRPIAEATPEAVDRDAQPGTAQRHG